MQQSTDYVSTFRSFIEATGQDQGRAQTNFLSVSAMYLGTRFVTSFIVAIDPINALTYELTAVAVDLVAGIIFADTGCGKFREIATTITPFTIALVAGCAPHIALTFAVSSVVIRALISTFAESEEFTNPNKNFTLLM